VAARCPTGAPTVIAVAPLLEDGSPFPTTFWLTCPRLVAAVHDLESSGESARFADRVASERDLAASLAAGDAAYRVARSEEGGGSDPCATVGVAGQADPLAVKCLHARLAAHLAGVPDPIGESVAGLVSAVLASDCRDERCHARAVTG
jgi:uncharacterized protein